MNSDALKVLVILAVSLCLVIPVYGFSGTITLWTPSDYTFTNEDNGTIEFNFSFEDSLNATADCDLYINSNSYGNVTANNDTNTTIMANDTLTEGYLYWYIECVNDGSNQSLTWTLVIDRTNITVDFVYPENYSNDVSPYIDIWLYDNFVIDNSSLTMEINGTNHTNEIDDDITWDLDTSNPDWGVLEYENESIEFNDNDIVNVTVYATDEAGNVMEPFNWSFKIDTEPPVLDLSLDPNESVGPNNPTNATIDATDDEYLSAGYYFSVIDESLNETILRLLFNGTDNDTEPLTHYMENETWDATGFILSNGTSNTTELITVIELGWFLGGDNEYDVFGELNGTSSTVAAFDTTTLLLEGFYGDPEIVDGVTTFTVINFNKSDPLGEGVPGETLVINQSTFRLYNVIANDSHDYSINAMIWDYAGNNDSKSEDITIDTTSPTVTLSSPGNNTWYTANNTPQFTIDFNFIPVENNDYLNCTLILYGRNATHNFNITKYNTSEIIDNTINTISYTWDNSTNDTYFDWKVNCNDTANNSGTSINRTWGIDRNLPTVSIPAGTQSGCQFIYVTWSGSDIASGIANYTLYRRCSTCGTWDFVVNTTNAYHNDTPLSDGSYVYKVNATDYAGWVDSSDNSIEISISCGSSSPPPSSSPDDEMFIAYREGNFEIINAESPSIPAGTTGTSTFTVINNKDNDITDVSITLTGCPENWCSLSTSAISRLSHNGGEQAVIITYTVPADAELKDYSITMTVSGSDPFAGTTHSDTETITLTVTTPTGETVTTEEPTGVSPLTGLFALIAENPAIFLIATIAIVVVVYTKFKDKILKFFKERFFRKSTATPAPAKTPLSEKDPILRRKGPTYKPKKL